MDNKSLTELNDAEKKVVGVIDNISYLMKLFKKEMEIGSNIHTPLEPPKEKEDIKEQGKLQSFLNIA